MAVLRRFEMNYLRSFLQLDQVQTYLTGSDLVSEDFVQSTEKGIQKTEIIAIIFIIFVLIAVFRSPIVPFVSLFTVGISYIVSLSIVAHLVNQFNFPFSNFTQVFLIVVLFGIGTDYNILLFTRFKEELGKQDGNRLFLQSRRPIKQQEKRYYSVGLRYLLVLWHYTWRNLDCTNQPQRWLLV